MAKLRALVIILILALGFGACALGILGFFYSVDKNGYVLRLSNFGFSIRCVAKKTPMAFGLGIAGGALLFGAQVLSNALGGCPCCLPNFEKGCCSIVCLVFSWILTIVSIPLMVVGGVVQSSAVAWPVTLAFLSHTVTCQYEGAARAMFAGGVGAFLATVFSATYYGLASADKPIGVDAGQGSLRSTHGPKDAPAAAPPPAA